MAFIQCDFHSETLRLACSMNVILPQATTSQIGLAGVAPPDRDPPVLYLLHGLSDDHTIWMRRTSIERYAASLGLAVVMPSVNRSFYADMKNGLPYWGFVSEELPEIVAQLFGLRPARERTFVAGLSMGGYGAFKLALAQPERFAAAASLSGALNMRRRLAEEQDEANARERAAIFGDPERFAGSENDLFGLAERLVASDRPRPRLYQCCGLDDFLYEDNQSFLERARELELAVTYEEGPGAHEWGYWDSQIQRVLEWLPLPLPGGGGGAT